MSIARLIERTVDINKAIRCENLETFFKHDSLAHTFQIAVVSNGSPVNLTGYSAVAYFNRPTADTVAVVGSVTGNVVSITLAEACYAYEGHFTLVIRLTDGESSKIAIYWADGNVRIDSNDATVDPGGVVPDLTELLAKIDQMEQATADARDAISNLTVDSSLSTTSTHPVQNKVINQAFRTRDNTIGEVVSDTVNIVAPTGPEGSVAVVDLSITSYSRAWVAVTGEGLRRVEAQSSSGTAITVAADQTNGVGGLVCGPISMHDGNFTITVRAAQATTATVKCATGLCANDIINEAYARNALTNSYFSKDITMHDGTGDVTLSAAQLRQLLALLN